MLQGPKDPKNMEQVWLAWPPWGHLPGPADLGMLRVPSPLPLKRWSSLLSFLWERTVLLLQGPMAEIRILPPNLILSKDCSHVKPARTDSSGWPWPLRGHLTSAFKTLWACAFLPMEKNIFQVQPSLAKTGNPPLKFHISKE